MSGSKIHSVPAGDACDDDDDYGGDEEKDPSGRRGQRYEEEETHHENDDFARDDDYTYPPPGNLEAIDLNASVRRIPAPWPGLHGQCKSCGAPSVSGLGSGPQTCEHCPAGHVKGGRKAVGGGAFGKPSGRVGKEVAVTSVREVALSKEQAAVLRWTGSVMLGMSSLLLVLLLTAWEGIDFTLARNLSPWLGVYLPIPLGLLDGIWSLHCASRGFVRYQGSGSCVYRAGFCGTSWGCSGPSCALNLGLDLGVVITATIAALPAGASGKACGYHCLVLLCLPCAPNGGEGMAAAMVLAALGLAVGAARKMWTMTFAVREGTMVEGFLPW